MELTEEVKKLYRNLIDEKFNDKEYCDINVYVEPQTPNSFHFISSNDNFDIITSKREIKNLIPEREDDFNRPSYIINHFKCPKKMQIFPVIHDQNGLKNSIYNPMRPVNPLKNSVFSLTICGLIVVYVKRSYGIFFHSFSFAYLKGNIMHLSPNFRFIATEDKLFLYSENRLELYEKIKTYKIQKVNEIFEKKMEELYNLKFIDLDHE